MDAKQLDIKRLKSKLELEIGMAQYYVNEMKRANPKVDKREEKLAYNKGVLATYEYVLSLIEQANYE